MNKRIIFGLMFVFMILPFCMAADVDMKEDLKLGETFVAKVSGNFLDKIEFENIDFFRTHVDTSMKDIGVLEIDEEFYIYGQVPEERKPDNYSIQIKDVRYMKGSQISEDVIVHNFTISGETVDFSVSPLVLFLNNTGSFEIQNLKESKIEIEFENFSQESFNLKSGEIKTIEVPFKNNSGLENFRIFSGNQSYDFYVYHGINDSFEEEVVESEVNESIIVDENKSETDVEVVVAPEGVPSEEREEGKEEIRKSDLTCAQLEGIFCVVKNATFAGEICDGEKVDSQTGECCIGECELKKESNTGKTIGWLLIIAVVIFLTMFFKSKFKK